MAFKCDICGKRFVASTDREARSLRDRHRRKEHGHSTVVRAERARNRTRQERLRAAKATEVEAH
eukprot:3721340-Alexandrium_andersonii.AAC.1